MLSLDSDVFTVLTSSAFGSDCLELTGVAGSGKTTYFNEKLASFKDAKLIKLERDLTQDIGSLLFSIIFVLCFVKKRQYISYGMIMRKIIFLRRLNNISGPFLVQEGVAHFYQAYDPLLWTENKFVKRLRNMFLGFLLSPKQERKLLIVGLDLSAEEVFSRRLSRNNKTDQSLSIGEIDDARAKFIHSCGVVIDLFGLTRINNTDN